MMKKNKRISIKYLGTINSNGSDNSNIDTFNIYSKSALFNYDNAKELNKQCALMEENSEKHRKSKYTKRYFPEFFHDIQIKKNNFLPHSWYMDDIGGAIDINLIKHPDIGEGVMYSPSFTLFQEPGEWLKPSFIKYFVKFNKPLGSIKIDDNKFSCVIFQVNFVI